MTNPAEIFEKNYQAYCDRLKTVDFDAVKDILGLVSDGGRLKLRFFDRFYQVSAKGIHDDQGNRPDYHAFIILSQYVLLCPDKIYTDEEWAAYKDLKRASHFTNVNYFTTDAEQAIEKPFSGNLASLIAAGERLGGIPEKLDISYDAVMRFSALPRISLLMLFNEADEEFAATCSVLFQRQAEFYLDPESLAMTGAYLAKRLAEVARAG
jgi:hypothetical protein